MNMIFSRKLIAGFTALAVIGGFFAQLSIPQTVFAADTISTAQYLDTDDDGTVDRIRWTMDENITACTYEAGDWTVNTASEMTLVITSLSCTGSDAILDILVSADSQETGATTAPVISYADAGTTGSVTLTSGDMAAHASVTTVDAAKPILKSANLANANGSNRINFTYSEELFSGSGASSATFADITAAGTVVAIGSFATTGNVYTQTTKNWYLGTAPTVLQLYIAYGAGGYMVDTSTTEPSGVFTPVASALVADNAGNQVNVNYTPTAAGGGSWDLTKPTVSSATVVDAAGDNGMIDQIQLIFSKDMRDNSFTNADGVLGASGTTTGTFSTTVGADTDINDDRLSFNRTADDNTVDTTATAGDFTYDASTTFITDREGNLLSGVTVPGAIDSDDETEVDGASPIVISVTPASGATGVDRSADIVMTFSEPMDTTFDESTEFTVTADPGTFTEVWSNSDKTVTLSHPPFICISSISVATAEAEVVDAAAANTLNTSATLTGDWTFTTTGCSSGSTSGSAVPYYEIDVTGPGFGDVYVPGDDMVITWDDSSTTYQGYVNLYFSADQGATHELIVKNAANNGSYTWTAPQIDTEGGTILVQLTDMVEIIAEDYSLGYFTINYTIDRGEAPIEVTAPTTGDQGISPVTGELEDISEVSDGSYIKSVYFDTVYYVDADMMRHPFMDRQTYFTWQESFDSIEVVTDATLMTLQLGAPMLPKPAVTLVKIQSATRVYAVVDSGDMFSPILRAISDEEAASLVYGSDWADYVIDIQVTLFPRFQFGDWIYGTSDIAVDKSLMKTRESIN